MTADSRGTVSLTSHIGGMRRSAEKTKETNEKKNPNHEITAWKAPPSLDASVPLRASDSLFYDGRLQIAKEAKC